jgi:hypothetical protein
MDIHFIKSGALRRYLKKNRAIQKPQHPNFNLKKYLNQDFFMGKSAAHTEQKLMNNYSFPMADTHIRRMT